jgi:arabinan endo-1,5-alpha-L-arabinosidase
MPWLPDRRWSTPLITVPAIAAVVATTTGAGVPSPIGPSILHDFADPTVLSVGRHYYAYSTNSRYGIKTFHVPVRSSSSLTGRWSDAHDAMPELPAWVDTGTGEGSVWAPAVTTINHDGYLLYFTARSASQHTHCIGVARAREPGGPFRPIGSQPLVCRPRDVNAVDPKPFTDTGGVRYLLYSASHEGNDTIWLQRLTTDGTETIGDRRALIQADRADEDHIVEAPAMIRHGGTYVLFYSGNAYNSGRYFVNYATADALCDQFVKHPGQLLNQHTLNGTYQNPGGQDVVHTHGQDFLVFHAFTSLTRRSMFVAVLEWHHYPAPRSLDERRWRTATITTRPRSERG